jgi:hypothetical protein
MLEIYCDMNGCYQIYHGTYPVSGLFETKEEAINDICLDLIN